MSIRNKIFVTDFRSFPITRYPSCLVSTDGWLPMSTMNPSCDPGFRVPQSPPSKLSHKLPPPLSYDFSSPSVIQHDRAAIGSDAADVSDVSVGLERNLAITARSDSENFGALQINFERGDWAQGYVIENTGEIESDGNWKEDLLPSGSSTDRDLVSKSSVF